MKLGSAHKARLGPFGLHKSIAIATAAVIALLAVALSFASPDAFWNFFQIGHMRPVFADLRTIPHPSEYTGIRENIGIDPWGRGFNYPEIWIYIISTMRLSHDPYLAFGILQVLLIGSVFIFSIFQAENKMQIFAALALLFSPPVLLLIERGNNDATAFFVCVLAAISSQPFLRGALITLSGGLKIFPIFGAIMIARKFSKAALMGMLVMLPIFLWAAFDYGEISAQTPTVSSVSFGTKNIALLVCGKVHANIFTCQSFSWIIYAALHILASALLLKKFLPQYAQVLDFAFSGDVRMRILLIFGGVFSAVTLFSGSFAYRAIFATPILYCLAGTKTQKGPVPKLTLILMSLGFLTFWVPMIPGYGWQLFPIAAFSFSIALLPLLLLALMNEVKTWTGQRHAG